MDFMEPNAGLRTAGPKFRACCLFRHFVLSFVSRQTTAGIVYTFWISCYNRHMSKIVLIGQSATGKSSVHFKLLESGIISVEMDVELGTERCPEFEAAMRWMQDGAHSVATLGVHSNLIKRMAWEKDREYYSDLFDGLRFVYLQRSIEKAEHLLSLPTLRGKMRPEKHVKSVMRANNDLSVPLFNIADISIDHTDKDLGQVFKEVLEYVQGLRCD